MKIGLTSIEAQNRLAQSGPNELIASRLESRFDEIKKIFLDPMGLMLLGLAILYWGLGDKTDAIVLLIAYIPVTLIDVFLELRASKALRALKATLTSTARIFRDEKITEVPIQKIVVGDVLVFEEGQSLPADGTILRCESLTLNEAALTGESLPVQKSEGHKFFCGTVVMQGQGHGIVDFTGKNTKYGKIASLLEDTSSEVSPLRKKVDALVKKVVLIALALAICLFVIEYLRTSELISSVIVALTFGMASVPEEFPLVYTLYLSLGAWRLSKHGVLIKSLPSVETLGSVDIICTDKTGTLTEGKFQLEEIRELDPSVSKSELWRAALMACEVQVVDSMETAIFAKGNEFKSVLDDWSLTWDYIFEPSGKHMSHVWKNVKTDEFIIAMKGAVEGVIEHCEVGAAERSHINELVLIEAGKGKRLLGLAVRKGPCNGTREQDERGLKMIGIMIFNDPIRSTVKDAIHACEVAGIEIKILTGDHPLTAHAVADEIGLTHSHDHLFTGAQLSLLPDADRRLAYEKGAIFSRVLPEQKYELVRDLKASGKIVAMTGDGINDAPALKLADIGISMGKDATDVARSSAKMVLLSNNFSGLVEAVFEGRKIFSNLRRSFSYLISFHIPIVLLALIPSTLGGEKILLPIHIILLELIVHPISAFAFENLGQRVQNRHQKGLMSKMEVARAVCTGLLVSVSALLLFYYFLQSSTPEEARSIAFAVVIFGNIFFVVAESIPIITRQLFIVIGSLAALIAAISGIPLFRETLHFGNINLTQISIAFGFALLSSAPGFAKRKS